MPLPPKRLNVHTKDDRAAAVLAQVPGVIVTRERGRAGEYHAVKYGLNAAAVVERVLHEGGDLRGVGFTPDADHVARCWGKARAQLSALVDFKKYQLPPIDFLFARGRGLIRAACGSGKSLMGIVGALGLGGRWLIVTKAANRAGYVKEFRKWTTLDVASAVHVITGHDNEGREIPDDAMFAVVAVESLQFHAHRILRWCPTGTLWDESDLVKSNERWKAIPHENDAGVRFLRKRNRAATAQDISVGLTYSVLTTATPFPNTPRDGYAQGDLLEPAGFGTWANFATRYCARKKGTYGVDDSGSANIDELRERWAAVSYEVDEKDVKAEMPPVRVEPVYIEKEDQTVPEDVRAELISHDEARAGLMLASLKARGYALSRTLEYVAAGKKVVLFTGWRADAERVAQVVSAALGSRVKRGGGKRKRAGGANAVDEAHASRVPVTLIHGGTGGSGTRLADIEEFVNTPGGGVLVGTIDALGRSVDGLQYVALALFLMLPWTPGALEQAVGRFPRLGRVDPCLIELLVPLGSYAERVMSDLIDKIKPIAVLAPSELNLGLRDAMFNGKGTDRAFELLLSSPVPEHVTLASPVETARVAALDMEV